MPRPSQVRRQQAEKEGGHLSSGGLEPHGYRVVLHDWRRRPSIGEVVLALLKSQVRAVRAEVLAEEEDGRWRVRPLGGIECQIFEWPPEESVPLGRLAPAYRDWPEPTVVVVDDTHGFRRLARLQVESGDKVVEIGCSYGHCSRAIVGPGDIDLLGLDVSDVCVRHCASLQLPRARFDWFNALCSRTKLRHLLAAERPDVLVCDINGRRVLPDIIELLEGSMGSMGSMTLGTASATTRGAQEAAAAPPGASQPAEAPLQPHIPRVLVLKSEALAAHLAASAVASDAVGAASAASAASAETERAYPPAQPVVARILLVAFIAFLIARRLRSA